VGPPAVMAVVGHRIGVIGGDGIGPEVIAEGLKVIRAAGVELDTVDYDLGGARYLRDGTVLPDEIIDEWRASTPLYLGAVGTPEVPPGLIERGLLLKMRFDLDLYVNLRPFVFAGDDTHAPHDFVVIRENTEGTYAGEGGFLRKGTAHESPPRVRSTPAWASSAASATASSSPAAGIAST
jgi:3-isopropylmalate dehydrogenase